MFRSTLLQLACTWCPRISLCFTCWRQTSKVGIKCIPKLFVSQVQNPCPLFGRAILAQRTVYHGLTEDPEAGCGVGHQGLVRRGAAETVVEVTASDQLQLSSCSTEHHCGRCLLLQRTDGNIESIPTVQYNIYIGVYIRNIIRSAPHRIFLLFF